MSFRAGRAVASSEPVETGRTARLPAVLVGEADGERAALLSVRAQERIVARLEDDRHVTARIGAPDDEVAAADRFLLDLVEVFEQRSRPAFAAVVEPVRIGSAREEVAEG